MEKLGLRERKKAATRQAIHEAAVHLALELGPERVTVDLVADAAQVSRRTFSNYFANKEEAIFHADHTRLRRLVALVAARPAGESARAALAGAARELVAESPHSDPVWVAQRRLLRGHPSLAAHQVAAYAVFERDLTSAVATRLPDPDPLRSRVLAVTFLAALRAAAHVWLDHPDRSFGELVEEALDCLSGG
ncbi:TetR/AcrR family transcriptional regulator [Saccharothrix violaceirubra]|uniref:AcrR family transcriptional regulator n=1 Tax=Saccharothrix violaceirubra TaxID=413306 RepID=A0A7W7T5N4_9PSEU|nr:TetR family transcriptional regulator [Saccharothrix violaceirubra]MBB4967015.1 AcrR family transcriptional regulator [Saccharothrix violaceirubra]